MQSLSTKRSRSNPVTNLTILPYTPNEWKSIMEEVRRLYLKGKYRQCAERCKQILQAIKDPHRVHPLYSIYLSFFTASSMEITAGAMSNYSNDKVPFFQEALDYYLKAASQVDIASFSVIDNSACQAPTSRPSSTHSSVNSTFSHSCPANMSSPSTPVNDTDRSTSPRSIMSSNRNRPKKKVLFSDDVQDAKLFLHSPISYTSTSPSPRFPASPNLIIRSPSSTTTIEVEKYDSYSTFLLAQSVTRDETQLISLSSQIQYHITSIHAQMANISSVRNETRGDVMINVSCSATERVKGDEMQRMEIRERIRCLKEVGWQRKRFDPTKYRALCETALEEIEQRV